MRITTKTFHLIASMLLLSTTIFAQLPVDFDGMWADCSLVCKPTAEDKFFQHPDFEERMQKALEVSGILDELGAMRDNFLKTGDLKDLFPTLYYNTTKTEFDAIMKDSMDYPVDKMNMMQNFYDAFKSNRTAFESGGVDAVERQWKPYYQKVNDIYKKGSFNMVDVRQLTNDAIYAHVKHDLPRAIRDTIDSSNLSKAQLKGDFDKTNPFFGTSTNLSNADIAKGLFNNGMIEKGMLKAGSMLPGWTGLVTDVIKKRRITRWLAKLPTKQSFA